MIGFSKCKRLWYYFKRKNNMQRKHCLNLKLSGLTLLVKLSNIVKNFYMA